MSKTPITDKSVKTTDWASGEPVVLEKEMRELEVKYQLEKSRLDFLAKHGTISFDDHSGLVGGNGSILRGANREFIDRAMNGISI